MKIRPGDALRMIEATFGPVEIVEWNGKILRRPTPPPIDMTPPAPEPVKEVVTSVRPDSLFD